jgi:hypothetical protein
MQCGQLLELWLRQAFETGIARMQRAGQVGSGKPEPQGLGIDAQQETTRG